MPRRERPITGRLAPPGQPNIICPYCLAAPKPPGRSACFDCYQEGYVDRRGRDVRKYPEVVSKLKLERARQLTALKETQLAANRKGTRAASKRTSKKLSNQQVQVDELDRLLTSVMACFEKDTAGQYQLYEDRMPELTAALVEAENLLPAIRKLTRPRRKSTSGA